MKKVLTYSILLIILISAFSFAQDTNEKADKAKIQSTEGLEVTKSDENSIINSKTDNKEAKQKTKNRKIKKTKVLVFEKSSKNVKKIKINF